MGEGGGGCESEGGPRLRNSTYRQGSEWAAHAHNVRDKSEVMGVATQHVREKADLVQSGVGGRGVAAVANGATYDTTRHDTHGDVG